MEDTDPAILVVLDNHIAGACIGLYIPPASEDTIESWINMIGKLLRT